MRVKRQQQVEVPPAMSPLSQLILASGGSVLSKLSLQQLVNVRQGVRQAVTPSRGAMVIIERMTDPLTYALIKDSGKSGFGFPYGGMDPPDGTICVTAEREVLEEVGLIITVTPGDALEVLGYDMHEVHIFTKQVPADRQLTPGEEQESAAFVPASTIEAFIEAGIVLPKHARAWRSFTGRKR